MGVTRAATFRSTLLVGPFMDTEIKNDVVVGVKIVEGGEKQDGDAEDVFTPGGKVIEDLTYDEVFGRRGSLTRSPVRNTRTQARKRGLEEDELDKVVKKLGVGYSPQRKNSCPGMMCLSEKDEMEKSVEYINSEASRENTLERKLLAISAADGKGRVNDEPELAEGQSKTIEQHEEHFEKQKEEEPVIGPEGNVDNEGRNKDADRTLESRITKVKEYCNRVVEATGRYVPGAKGGKLQFNYQDQLAVKECMDGIAGEFSALCYELGRLEEREKWFREELRRREEETRTKSKEIDRNKEVSIDNRLEELENNVKQIRDILTGQTIVPEKKSPSEMTEETESRETPRNERFNIDMNTPTTSSSYSVAVKNNPTVTEKIEQNKPEGRTRKNLPEKQAAGPGWKTPEKKEKTLVIRTREKTGNDKTYARVKEAIKDKKLYEKIKDVGKTKDGKVILRVNSEEGAKSIEGAIELVGNLEVSRSREHEPLIMFTGLKKGWKFEEIREIILEENTDIQERFNKEWMEETIHIKTIQCRNKGKENWVIQTNLELFKHLMKRGKIYFDLMVVHVAEYVDVAVCFKCCKFGHTAKHCSSEARCYNCGEEHEGRNCSNKEEKICFNCKLKNNGNWRHKATSKECPIYWQRVKEKMGRIRYSREEDEVQDTPKNE